MMLAGRLGRSATTCSIVGSLLVGGSPAGAQVEPVPAHESRFFESDGTRLRYLDFGGEGSPILLTAGTAGAESWAEFAPRFADQYRVVAIHDRVADGELLSDSTRAHDILRLMAGLQLERVVLMGNANAGRVLAYLGERHPERLAGLVFLGNAPEVGGTYSLVDPTGAMQMAERAVLSIRGLDPDMAGQAPDGVTFRPRYMQGDGPTIGLPSLTFANLDGTRGLERSSYPLFFAEQIQRGAFEVPDSVSRQFFERVNSNESLKNDLQLVWDTLYAPAIVGVEEIFYGAFSGRLDVVRIEVAQVTGYEYRDAPDLIEPHVRRFLDGVR